MEGSLRRLALLLIASFVAIVLALGAYTFVTGPRLLLQAGPFRDGSGLEGYDRGTIYARGGELLAVTFKSGSITRTYPQGEASSHVIGYRHPRFGLAGLEAVLDRHLRRDDVITTLDLGLQQLLFESLKDVQGAAVALRVEDGAILAMVSRPGFDPNHLDHAFGDPVEGAPFFNRATHGQYPPGSAIKPIIAIAGLDSGTVRPDALFDDLGFALVDHRRINNAAGVAYGSIALDEALSLSSNAAFVELAVEIGQEPILDTMTRLGFGRAITMELNTASGQLPSPVELTNNRALAEMAIGQGTLLVTPLQMAAAVASIANEGVWNEPYLVAKGNKTPGTGHLETFRQGERVMTKGAANMIAAAMVQAAVKGTAKSAAPVGMRIAGKTGTAENAAGPPHAWFIGFAPATKPQIAIAIVVEHGGSGGASAAPIARRVFESFISLQEAPKSWAIR